MGSIKYFEVTWNGDMWEVEPDRGKGELNEFEYKDDAVSHARKEAKRFRDKGMPTSTGIKVFRKDGSRQEYKNQIYHPK